jgi:hypothetical protein
MRRSTVLSISLRLVFLALTQTFHAVAGPVESRPRLHPLQLGRRPLHPRVPPPLHREREPESETSTSLLQEPLGADCPRHRAGVHVKNPYFSSLPLWTDKLVCVIHAGITKNTLQNTRTLQLFSKIIKAEIFYKINEDTKLEDLVDETKWSN